MKETNVEVKEDVNDIMDVIDGSKTVPDPVAEVIGHSFNKKTRIIKNLYLRMNYNFDCEREFVNALRMYSNAKPALKEEIYHYIYLLDK